MELKLKFGNIKDEWDVAFNRTAYGIEIGLHCFLQWIVLSFNRTAYGIEIELELR